MTYTFEYRFTEQWSKFKYQCSYRMFMFLVFVIVQLGDSVTVNITMCPILIVPDHGYFMSGYCEREIGSLCGFGCLTGYRLDDGDSFRECQSNGTWSGLQPNCQEIHCPLLKTTTHVIQECLPKQNSINLKFGTKCQARCIESHSQLLGSHTRECLILGIWSGYEQFCIVSNETTTNSEMTTTASAISTSPMITTVPKYYDYSNYALNIDKNDTGIVIPTFQSKQFSIVFWFYLENNSSATLVSLVQSNNKKVFEIVIRQNKLLYYHTFQNRTQPTLIKISTAKWNHFAWTYSIPSKRSYLYIDGARQQSFDFTVIPFDFKNVSSLILLDQLLHGRITKAEIWNEMISEQQLLVSYRDCRKQNGNIFSWSKISDIISIDTRKLKSSQFCTGCSEPASIHGGTYYVSDYEIGSSVDYKCDFGYEMMGASRAYCMVPSEWYPLPPVCKYNPCTINCELCDKKTGVCSRQQTRFNSNICNPPCKDDAECIDGQCTQLNIDDDDDDSDQNDNICQPPCSIGTQCENGRCVASITSSCPMTCRHGQKCVDGRCGCYKGLCERGRACYEICEFGERCYNWSCSCGLQGKCNHGEVCLSDICMCGTRRGGCRPHEQCVNGRCICKTNFCDKCDNKCKSNEICFNGKCICSKQCRNVFCPFPCLHGGRCTGFYQCTCHQGWTGHRCEYRSRKNV
ncbi:hypothetical protein I4U23_025498 [Adineta vaga]|nr:hypothetical protein I4U23_025498 [Adineta vaga]